MKVFDLSGVAGCVGTAWSPVIGDPTLMGWVTVAAYLATALACFAAMRTGRADRRFWQVLGLVLLLLCVNKQLDLQSALTAAGRCAAQIQGWYDQRRIVQMVFIAVLLVLSAFAMILTVLLLRDNLRRVGVAVIGLGLLLTYVAVRAAGFHHMDAFINATFGPVKLNWMFELSGIVVILANAIAAWRTGPGPASPGGIA